MLRTKRQSQDKPEGRNIRKVKMEIKLTIQEKSINVVTGKTKTARQKRRTT